ncbi:MAG TPA: tetratricopeptide repeat protein [Pirellulales bacterium]|nr:tetratricopeptide repeat protein [Pirellulales bacterium]
MRSTAQAALAAGLLAIVSSGLTGCRAASQVQNAQGVRQFQQGQYQAAIQRFQKAVASDPNNANSYYNLASAYHRLGDLNHRQEDLVQAENYYNQCLDHDQNHRDCYRALAVMLVEEHRSQEALRLLEIWANHNPTSSAPKVELARLYQEFGQRDAARAQLLEALSVNPYDSQASAALGRLYEEDGNQSQALVNYQRSLGQNSFQPELAARADSIRTAMGTNSTVPPAPGSPRMVGAGSQPLY